MIMGRSRTPLAWILLLLRLATSTLATKPKTTRTRHLRAADDVFASTLPVITPEPLLPLTPDKLELVALASRLSLSTYQTAPLSHLLYDIDEFDYLADGGIVLQGKHPDDSGILPLDRVLLYEKDSYCFVSYMGTFVSIDEWTQNLNLTTAFVRSRDNSSCQFRGGFVEAYENAQPHKVADWIDRCINNNLNDDPSPPTKQLVVTGHSQGGAMALIAAFVHQQHRPLVITVGQPPSLTQPHCDGIVDDHVWRFINTEDNNNVKGLLSSRNSMNYDLVPHVDLFLESLFNKYSLWCLERGGGGVLAEVLGLDLSEETLRGMRAIYENGDTPNYELYGYHVGPSIYLPPGTSIETVWDDTPSQSNPLFVGNSVYYRDKNHTASYMEAEDLDVLDPREVIPLNTAHYFWVYVLKLDELFLRALETSAVRVDGFSVGSMCNYDFECETGATCDKHNNICSF